jgi:hypothetical protein
MPVGPRLAKGKGEALALTMLRLGKLLMEVRKDAE